MEKIDNDWDLLSLRSCELHTSLAEITDENQAHKLICDFLRVNQKNSSLIVPDFDKSRLFKKSSDNVVLCVCVAF